MGFQDRLRMDNLYPTLPQSPSSNENYPLFDEFLSRVAPSSRGNLTQVANQVAAPEFRQTGQNTVYQPSYGDIAREKAYGRDVYGIDPDSGNNDYRLGQLALRQQEINQKGQQNQATNDLNQKKLGITQQRANVYEFKSKNPGDKFQVNKATGDLESINPVTGKTTNHGKFEMPQEDLIALNQENKLGQISATGEQNRETQAEGQTGKESLSEMAARHAKELEDIKAQHATELEKTKEAGKTTSPSQQKIGTTNRAQLAMDTHPEWAKYIVKTPGGGYYIKPTGMMNGAFSGPDEKTRKDISDFINSNQSMAPVQSVAPTTKQPTVGDTKTFPNGKVGKWDGTGWVAVPVKK